MLLVASYFFYASWHPEYLILLIMSTLADYFFALRMSRFKTKEARRPYLIASISFNLSILVIFKYFHFFREISNSIFRLSSLHLEIPDHSLLLPVGLSFYTFQSLSYTIDVYRGDFVAERHLGRFAAFISFFPQLVAGPIERARHLLPQFYDSFKFDEQSFKSGCQLILWGFFKKIVISDRLAIIANTIFNDPQKFDGYSLWAGVLSFSFQIYCDFSGYSDIAIGVARLFGFQLNLNFRQPYLADSLGDFWHRWHISLSTWFRDYLYLPLGGDSRVKGKSQILFARNIFLTFVLSGFWHGASWTFLMWGFIHAMGYLMNRWANKSWYRIWSPFRIIFTFLFVSFAWIFFRANSLSDAFLICSQLFRFQYFDFHSILHFSDVQAMIHSWGMVGEEIIILIVALFFLITAEIYKENSSETMKMNLAPRWMRWTFYYFLVVSCMFFGGHSISQSFIYFQF